MSYITLDNWMPRDVQDTSKEAFRKIRPGTLYSKIIHLLSKNPDGLSIGEAASLLAMQKSTISARFNELKTVGILAFHEQRTSSESGMTNNFYILSKHYKDFLEMV